jgi:hypothetical protein
MIADFHDAWVGEGPWSMVSSRRGFSEPQHARDDPGEREASHLADDVVNQLRRKSPPTRALPLGGGRGCWKARVPTENPDEPKRIRLAQIDGDQARRQVRLYPEGNTRLPPGEQSQKLRL